MAIHVPLRLSAGGAVLTAACRCAHGVLCGSKSDCQRVFLWVKGYWPFLARWPTWKEKCGFPSGYLQLPKGVESIELASNGCGLGPGTKIVQEPAGVGSTGALGPQGWAGSCVGPHRLWAAGSPSARHRVLHEKLFFMFSPFPGCHPIITPTHFLQLYFMDDKHFAVLFCENCKHENHPIIYQTF